MNRVIKGIVWFITAFFVIFVGGGYVLPNEVTVQRQAVISAPPEKIFAIVGDYRRFQEWSPWADIDSATTYKLEGAVSGVGQKMTWASNNPNVGAGSQVITTITENSHIGADLDLGNMGKASSFWDLKPAATGTEATWGFKMKLDGVLDRWMGLLMDRFVGPDYEKGLSRVKALAEKEVASG
jgi:ribosome-associated toxin RatA of RatAB toxin-antitoxin module